MSTKLLKHEHRLSILAEGLPLRTFAALMARLYPRSQVGRAALAWWQRKSPTRAALVEREGAETIASMQRVEARLFGEGP